MESKRIILTTFGSFGDIHPYMAISMELQRRGHEPVIATSALYQGKIEGVGLRFAAVRPNLPPPQEQDQEMMNRVMEPKAGPKYLMEELIFPHVRDGYDDLLAISAGADLLVTHPITFAGPLVARKTGIPWISTVLAPLSFFSAYDPPVPPFWPWLVNLKVFGPGALKVMIDFTKRTYRAKSIDVFREELGIADYGNPIFDGQHSPELILALFSKVFAAPQPDWPPQARITGFAFYDGRHEKEMPPELLQFLNAGPAPIVFTLGSSAVWVARDFFHESIAAAKKLKRRAVLLIGDERNRPQESLPPEIIAVDYAPFESLLERGSVMVHHGGVGTTSQGLRAGIPTLIVPFAFDQSDNAAHAERLGTSRTLYRKQYQAARVAGELEKLLSNPQYASKAKQFGQSLRAENGVAMACDLIEDFLQRKPRPREEGAELAYASRN
ncbi:MAG: glycosyltransferase [Pyrinomonadaceae bacterium]